MSGVRRLVTEEQRNEEASQWIAKLESGLNADQAQQLREWMWEDSRNEEVLAEMAALWDRMDVLANLTDLFPHVPHHMTTKWRRAAIAASVVLAAIAGIWSVVDVNQEAPLPVMAKATYETRIGDQANMTLADGSDIRLNTNTRAVVALRENSRVIFLERGEIHVEVAHDPTRPFSVFAGNRIVQAVGTAFNVKLDDHQHVEVVVTDGRVLVGIRPNNDSASSVIAGSSLSVSEGERVVLDDEVGQIESLEPQEIEVVLSWREGNLIFQGESLREATEEIGRYTHIEFAFTDEDLKEIRIAGRFKAGDVEGFLSSLKASFGIEYERKNEQTILLSYVSEELQ